jgi:hypothetical protein
MITITYRTLAAEAEAKWHPDQTRLQKAVQIVEGKTSIYNQHCEPGSFDVRSQTALNSWYHVDTKRHTCTCTDSDRGNVCKHRLAVWLYVQQITRTHAEAIRRPQTVIMRELGYT